MIRVNRKRDNQMSAYIINALRTPIGSHGGQLACFRAPELGAKVIKSLTKDINLDLNIYDQVIMGNVLSAGLGQAPARQAAILAGMNVSTECLTINKMCGSGLIQAEKILKGVNGIGFTYFNDLDIVRHPLVKKIISAYDSSEQKDG